MASKTDMEAIQAELNRIEGKNDYKVLNGGSGEPKVYNGTISTEQEPSHKQRQTKCPCGEAANVFCVRRDGPNQGRLFASCDNCHRFQWLDQPLCKRCGERRFQGQVKSGKNKGKWFLSCPNRCSFMWLSHPHKGGFYEVI